MELSVTLTEKYDIPLYPDVLKKWRALEAEHGWGHDDRVTAYDVACMRVADDDALFDAVGDYVSNFESGIGDPTNPHVQTFVSILQNLSFIPFRNLYRGECRDDWKAAFGRGFHSWSLNRATAERFLWDCGTEGGVLLHITNRPVRGMVWQDILTWRMRFRQNESHYGGMQAEVFVVDEDALRTARAVG